jgi:hypothetical protein
MSSLFRVTALVDWDTARRIASVVPSAGPRWFDAVFDGLQAAVAGYISSRDQKNFYRVNWRFYHGWHRGKTKTLDRIIFEKYLSTLGSRLIKRVSFGADFSFSETLCCGSRRSPILDTLRTDEDTQKPRQKMVDTSLVCDLLHLVRCKDSSLYIIVADDDDFIPALFTAEMWRGKVVLLHNRPNVNTHLQLDGLLARLGRP